jgi:hypothetical protein
MDQLMVRQLVVILQVVVQVADVDHLLQLQMEE